MEVGGEIADGVIGVVRFVGAVFNFVWLRISRNHRAVRLQRELDVARPRPKADWYKVNPNAYTEVGHITVDISPSHSLWKGVPFVG